MKQPRPYLKSVLLTLLLLIFTIISGVIIVLNELDGIPAILTQTAAFALAFVVGTRIAARQAGSVREVGLSRPVIRDRKAYGYFIPLLVIEIMPYFFGFKAELSLSLVLVYFLFALVVGFTEELYFRGLILDVLKPKKLSIIIVVSSLLFSLSHIVNLLAGQDLLLTLMQVVFALLFAIVTALIALASQSFLIPAIWHAIHNFTALITADNEGTFSVVVVVLQGLILLLYAVHLLRRKPDFLSR